jgi:hypothetical protein
MSKTTNLPKNKNKTKKSDFLNELRTLQKSGNTNEKEKGSGPSIEHYEAAYEAAYTYILKGFKDKMRRAAEYGKTRAYLYRWNYETDPKSRAYKFKGVRIFDIVTKGNLIERLTTHFQNINPEFFVGWHKFKTEDESKPTRYGIFVSWDTPKEKESDESGYSPDKDPEDDEESEEIEITC